MNQASLRFQHDSQGVDWQDLVRLFKLANLGGARATRSKELPVWRVLLVADGDARRFYQRLGFEPFGDVLARFDRTKLF